MATKARTWKCTRRDGGKPCGQVNARKFKKCQRCKKERPKHIGRKSAHMQVLKDYSYEWCVENLNEGKHECAICGAQGKTRKLHRDHVHRDDVKIPRGILCFQCNVLLRSNRWTPELLRKAADYLEKANRRMEGLL